MQPRNMDPNLENKKHDNNEDDDDDYMSDKYISETPSSKSSLIFSHRQRYQHQLHKRKAVSDPKSKVSMKELENHHRQEGLAKPLDPENRGFKLLQKMVSSSRTEKSSKLEDIDLKKLVSERKPIEIELRIGRQGLGLERKRPKLENKKIPERDIEKDQDRFLKFNIEKSELYSTKNDYFQLQKICLNLDSEHDVKTPLQEWYWPPEFWKDVNKATNEADGDSSPGVDDETSGDNSDAHHKEDEIDFNSRLKELNDYVRVKYSYCVWCGCRFESAGDLADNCPGNSRSHH